MSKWTMTRIRPTIVRGITKNRMICHGASHVPVEIEVCPALHGWCVPDMPLQDGKPIYNKPDAERAWAKLLALYKMSLT